MSEQAIKETIEGAYASEWSKGKYVGWAGEGMSAYFEDEKCQAVFMLMEGDKHIIVTKKELGLTDIPSGMFNRPNKNSSMRVLNKEFRTKEFLTKQGWYKLFEGRGFNNPKFDV